MSFVNANKLQILAKYAMKTLIWCELLQLWSENLKSKPKAKTY